MPIDMLLVLRREITVRAPELRVLATFISDMSPPVAFPSEDFSALYAIVHPREMVTTELAGNELAGRTSR